MMIPWVMRFAMEPSDLVDEIVIEDESR